MTSASEVHNSNPYTHFWISLTVDWKRCQHPKRPIDLPFHFNCHFIGSLFVHFKLYLLDKIDTLLHKNTVLIHGEPYLRIMKSAPGVQLKILNHHLHLKFYKNGPFYGLFSQKTWQLYKKYFYKLLKAHSHLPQSAVEMYYGLLHFHRDNTNMELFGRRRCRLVWTQLSSKFGYCHLWSVFNYFAILYTQQFTTWSDISPHLLLLKNSMVLIFYISAELIHRYVKVDKGQGLQG